jgi:hypothetical protein
VKGRSRLGFLITRDTLESRPEKIFFSVEKRQERSNLVLEQNYGLIVGNFESALAAGIGAIEEIVYPH